LGVFLLDEKTVPYGASIIIPIEGGLFVSLSPVGRGIKGEGEIQDKTNKTDSHQGCPYAGG